MTGLTPWSGTNHATLDFSGPDSSQSLEWVQTPSENEQFVACIACLTNLRCGGDQANTCYCYQPLHITHHPITLPNLEAAHEANTRSNFNSESGQDWLLDLGFAGTDQRYSCTVKKNIHNMVKMIRSCAYIPRAIAIGSAQFYTYFSCDANLVR